MESCWICGSPFHSLETCPERKINKGQVNKPPQTHTWNNEYSQSYEPNVENHTTYNNVSCDQFEEYWHPRDYNPNSYYQEPTPQPYDPYPPYSYYQDEPQQPYYQEPYPYYQEPPQQPYCQNPQFFYQNQQSYYPDSHQFHEQGSTHVQNQVQEPIQTENQQQNEPSSFIKEMRKMVDDMARQQATSMANLARQQATFRQQEESFEAMTMASYERQIESLDALGRRIGQLVEQLKNEDMVEEVEHEGEENTQKVTTHEPIVLVEESCPNMVSCEDGEEVVENITTPCSLSLEEPMCAPTPNEWKESQEGSLDGDNIVENSVQTTQYCTPKQIQKELGIEVEHQECILGHDEERFQQLVEIENPEPTKRTRIKPVRVASDRRRKKRRTGDLRHKNWWKFLNLLAERKLGWNFKLKVRARSYPGNSFGKLSKPPPLECY